MNFSDEQLLRYSRQLLLDNFDIAGQQALSSARVLIVGMGGLGCPAALYLAAAGIGHLYLADNDHVELSNLQRQILFNQQQLNVPKVAAAQNQLAKLNPHTTITALQKNIDEQAINRLADSIDLVLDCSDNANTRLDINRACHHNKLPLVSGAAIRWQGQLCSFDFRKATSPCYQCLFGEFSNDEQSCSENGIMSPIVGLIGINQALETIKIISGCGKPNFGKLRIFDGLAGEWNSFALDQNPDCSLCS